MTDPFSDYVRWRKAHDPNPDPRYLAPAKNIVPGKNPYRGGVAHEFTPTFWTGMQTVNLLREFYASPQPFLLFSSFFKPHSPYTVPVPFDTMYDGVEIPLPRIVTIEDIQRLPLPVQKQIKQTPGYQIDRQRLQWIYRSYYASVSMVDREVGLILDELEHSGKAEDPSLFSRPTTETNWANTDCLKRMCFLNHRFIFRCSSGSRIESLPPRKMI